MTIHEDPMRGTGRSTACLLETIAKALRNPGVWTPHEDHWANSPESHHMWLSSLANLRGVLGLDLDLTKIKGIAHVRSNAKGRK